MIDTTPPASPMGQRIEMKYFVSPHLLAHLRADLALFCHRDRHNHQEEGYTVASIYYENHAMVSYFDKIAGQQGRVKLRVRFYPPCGVEDPVWLEFKLKNTLRFFKRRVLLDQERFAALRAKSGLDSRGLLPWVGLGDGAGEGWQESLPGGTFRPFVRIDYQREAWFDALDPKVRLTFDRQLRCRAFDDDWERPPHLPVVPQGVTILEVKSPGYYPAWLAMLVRKYSLRRAAISKYGLAVQQLALNRALLVE